MKAYLMHRDRDVDLEGPLPENAAALEQDLELATLFDAMAQGDDDLRRLAERALLFPLAEPQAIVYRQEVLADCLRHPDVARGLYALAVEALDARQKARLFWFNDSPDTLLHKSITMLELLIDVLMRLRRLADDHAGGFRSDGFTRLFAELQRELDDDYLATVEHHLHELRFRRGPLISARLGRANRGTDYVLRRPHDQSLLQRIAPGGRPSHSFSIPPRDENGARALAELRGRGVRHVASAVAQATDHVLSYFTMLRAELGFYVSCLNLHEQLAEKGEPTCFPAPQPAGSGSFSARGLYDASLAFHLGSRVVGNDVEADGKRLVFVTGANQGGKSTFLRSVGLGQLMLQAGMFAPADSFTAAVCTGIFTHFKREEDASMTHGKLDEELHRMSEIVDRISPGALLLCNESFASTNEREGSEIARQLVRALTEDGVRVFFVTHQYDLAHGFHARQLDTALFLRAEREADGSRPFRLREAEPLTTSYGADSYRRIFAEGVAPAAGSA
ncbi:MAG: MutS-related protein [Gaiellaceae bacterium]